jgi:RNA polymerase sigma factor (TIGR02999 family)
MDGVARAVQSDLLRCARRLIAARPGPPGRPITLEPAELVNETFLRLLEQRQRLRDRKHFFAIATRVMLRVLLDYHRARGRRKRAGGAIRLSLGALGTRGAEAPRAEVPDVGVALDALGELDQRAARVVELRVLWGLSRVETAEVLGVSKATVERDWRFARAWLMANL